MNLTLSKCEGYELLDSGDGRKLERFGKYLLDRPCPQAIWPIDPTKPWQKADAAFCRTETGSGDWEQKKQMTTDPWKIYIEDLTFELRLTGFGNVGLFPEHVVHWKWMRKHIKATKKTAKILNLFAYTGGASMLCGRAGATVTHVDAARSVNGWAIENGQHNRLQQGAVRYLAEDAMKFVKKELRKGTRYDGIILDPPTFGRGSKGQVWKIERDFQPLVDVCKQLLSDKPLFIIATSHSPGVTPTVLENLLNMNTGHTESAEMLIRGPRHPLPAGVYARWTHSTDK